MDCTAIDHMLVAIISVRNQLNQRVKAQRAPVRADSASDLHELFRDDSLRFGKGVDLSSDYSDSSQYLQLTWDRHDWLTCIRPLGKRSHGERFPLIGDPEKLHYLEKKRSMLAFEGSMQRLAGTEDLLEGTAPTQKGRPQPRPPRALASTHALGSLVHTPETAGVLQNVPQMARQGELHHQPAGYFLVVQAAVLFANVHSLFI